METCDWVLMDGLRTEYLTLVLRQCGFIEEVQKSQRVGEMRFVHGGVVADLGRRAGREYMRLAGTPGAVASVERMLEETEMLGHPRRPVSAWLKSRSVYEDEQREQVQQEQARRAAVAAAPAQAVAQRQAARRVCQWRTTAAALTSIEARLKASGFHLDIGDDGLPAWTLGSAQVSVRPDASGTLGVVSLVAYSQSDFQSAGRIIEANDREMLQRYEADPKAAAQPIRKAQQAAAKLAAMSDADLRSALNRLPPRRRAALRKSLR